MPTTPERFRAAPWCPPRRKHALAGKRGVYPRRQGNFVNIGQRELTTISAPTAGHRQRRLPFTIGSYRPPPITASRRITHATAGHPRLLRRASPPCWRWRPVADRPGSAVPPRSSLLRSGTGTPGWRPSVTEVGRRRTATGRSTQMARWTNFAPRALPSGETSGRVSPSRSPSREPGRHSPGSP